MPLRGGCPGGNGGTTAYSTSPDSQNPGGGAGAVQIVSRKKIIVGSNGFVAANGGPGKGYTGEANIACLIGTQCFPGHGGGSGGGILLEAPAVEIKAAGGIVANGGGGHCDWTKVAEPGQLSATPAAGVVCSSSSRGSGGNGAAGTTAATNGALASGSDAHGGGGGGGAGRIRINLPVGSSFSPESNSVVSPPAAVGTLSVR